MSSSLRVMIAAPSNELHDRLFHRVRAEAEMITRVDVRTSVWTVPANRFEWFAGHCHDLGVSVRDPADPA